MGTLQSTKPLNSTSFAVRAVLVATLLLHLPGADLHAADGLKATETGRYELQKAAALLVLSDTWVVVVTETSEDVKKQLEKVTDGAFGRAMADWNKNIEEGKKPHWGAYNIMKKIKAEEFAKARLAIGEQAYLAPGHYSVKSPDDPNYKQLQPFREGTGAYVGVDGSQYFGDIQARYGIYAYLKMPKPMQSGKRYDITWPEGRRVSFIFDEKDTVSRLIKINQVGYMPAEKKFAYVGGWLQHLGPVPLTQYKKVELIDEAKGKVAWTGTMRLRDDNSRCGPTEKAPDKNKRPFINGEQLYDIDFSSVKTPGTYHLRIPGIGRSWSFRIGDDVYGDAFFIAMRGMFHQRGSFALEQPYTAWTRERHHKRPVYENGFLPFAFGPSKIPKGWQRFDIIGATTDRSRKTENVVGGWYDAADYDRNLSHYTNVVDMLNLYELRPGVFTDGQLFIPESGNGIPDLLDEAEFGMRCWLTSQDSAGGVSGYLETNTHPGIEDDKHVYSFSKRTTWSSLMFAMAASHYARLVKEHDAGMADTYLKAAQKAFAFGMDPKNRLTNYKVTAKRKRGAGDPYDLEYKETDEIRWWVELGARLQLHLATGDKKLLEPVPDLVDKTLAPYAWPYTFKDLSPWLFFPIVTSLKDEFPVATVQKVKDMLKNPAKTLVAQTEDMPYRRSWKRDQDFWMSWGASCHTNHNRAIWVSRQLFAKPEQLDAISANNAFSFGANPMGLSLTTGIGEVYPAVLQHDSSEKDGIPDPMPGITVYGFTAGYSIAMRHHVWRQDLKKGDKTEKIEFYKPPYWPVWRRWSPHTHLNASQCEFTVWETMSSTVFSTGMNVPKGWKPSDALKNRKPRPMERLHGYWYLP